MQWNSNSKQERKETIQKRGGGGEKVWKSAARVVNMFIYVAEILVQQPKVKSIVCSKYTSRSYPIVDVIIGDDCVSLIR